ncbi:hypothetical protein ABZ490_51190 [Streptomyces sp. NPDC005811]|uniref:hypothetical protein n=1 Tax=Streptomyces sp. NPDC005811 TaxID=3154565 RepID=UPI0033C1DDA2
MNGDITVRMRILIAGVAAGAALLTSGFTAPAQASGTAQDQNRAVADEGWTYALRAGDPVRDSYKSSATVLWRTEKYGQALHYYKTKVNSAGNLWYQLDDPDWGWIYCGNVAAPC